MDRLWHITKFFCNARAGCYPGMADIEQAFTPFNLAEAADWFPLRCLYGERLAGPGDVLLSRPVRSKN
jgi:hypothetical protein